MLIQELIVENFMSYEYARVPFKQGVNIIGGPNGAGKSSLLLAISVGLGQTSTERSRKLSDLIRWGQDQARVTLILDNTKQNNRRPEPKFNKDQLFLTRILRQDGKYWFELENHAASKQDVARLLGKFGVDPDNMLIIMHQNMVEQFSVLSNIDKLRMVEEAVGLEPFRENVVAAKTKLSRILTQEESVGKLLEQAEQTLNYWREQYEKFQEKKQLQLKRRFLDRELVWAEVERREDILKGLQANFSRTQQALGKIDEERQSLLGELDGQRVEQHNLKEEIKLMFEERLSLERQIAQNQSQFAIIEPLLSEAEYLQSIIDISKFKLLHPNNLREKLEHSQQQIEQATKQIIANQAVVQRLEESTNKLTAATLDKRVTSSLLEFKHDRALKEQETIEKSLKEAQETLNVALTNAQQSGERIAVTKSAAQIQEELGLTAGHLVALSNISDEIERQYESYSKLYFELKEKAQLVAEKREKTLEEVQIRMNAWRTVIEQLLSRVNLEYQRIMNQTLATGEVQLSNPQDITTAGLDIYVGFKGSKPVTLNAYTQSGGERTTATMGFLLALQHHVRSPFRAVDEYDIHMDPKNREMIAKVLVAMIKDAASQYVIITPSQITFAQQNAHVITVQNLEGNSLVREVIK
ncbi:MAG: AAA family ATPase [Candidatus Bathyarchaeota archaeon]|nr:AAA family ATPase [Candidatus Termitimicrobium sp.]